MGRNDKFGPQPGVSKEAQEMRGHVDVIAWVLDNAIRLPGGFRIGVDALLGLIPFIGDAAGVLLSAYIVRQAARLGAPPSVLMRMAANVAVEGIVGMIPLAGDIFDAAWKANQRNARLLGQYLDNPRDTTKSSRTLVGLLLFGLIVFMAILAVISALFLNWIWNAIRG